MKCMLHTLILLVISTPGNLTWLQAEQRCLEDGGQLAVLDTPELLRDVNDKVLVKDTPLVVFIGLRTATSGFPPMYIILPAPRGNLMI
ncbi:hypothetical protein BaRGS_00012119 [Batillaria attramentaria]|uniref:C-type lectin domain-containing protein n=1 Tax=Batillaria attramentaria TaxID=370345 RepID=A0ABD0LB03_9CAEN